MLTGKSSPIHLFWAQSQVAIASAKSCPREAIHSLSPVGVKVSHLTFTPTGDKLWMASRGQDFAEAIATWDCAQNKWIGDDLPVNMGQIQSLALSPDGKTLVAGGRSG